MQDALNKYVCLFCSLHTNKQKGMPAPHKAVLLLSIIDIHSHRIENFFTNIYDHQMIEDGVLLKDMIYLKRNL